MWPWQKNRDRRSEDSEKESGEMERMQGDDCNRCSEDSGRDSAEMERMQGEDTEKAESRPLIQHKVARKSSKRTGESAAVVLICVLCVWMAIVVTWQSLVRQTVRYETQTFSCGNSTEEARAARCAFDLLSHSWVAQQCADARTEEEYRRWLLDPKRARGPFPFFRDAEGQQHIADESALSARASGASETSRRVYTTREQQRGQCEFVLRRLHRGMEGLVRLNDAEAEMEHTEQCLDKLRRGVGADMGELVMQSDVGFTSCTVGAPVLLRVL
jgi:hypothetical protein